MLQKQNRLGLAFLVVIIIGSTSPTDKLQAEESLLENTELDAPRSSASSIDPNEEEGSISDIEKASGTNCEGELIDLFVTRFGRVVFKMSFTGSWHDVCNLEEARFDVSPKVCTYWFALGKSAVERNLTFVARYSTGDLPDGTCSSLPGYMNAPQPHYLRLIGPPSS